jgi:hypothetical protein
VVGWWIAADIGLYVMAGLAQQRRSVKSYVFIQLEPDHHALQSGRDRHDAFAHH